MTNHILLVEVDFKASSRLLEASRRSIMPLDQHLPGWSVFQRSAHRRRHRRSVIATILTITAFLLSFGRGQNLDQFTYEDSGSTDPNFVYPPKYWDLVKCGDLDQCVSP